MSWVVLIFILFTLAVLIAGIIVMVRGGSVSQKYSNKLMQYRVIFQAITITALVVFIYYAK